MTAPDWIRRPSGEDFARYYPREALRQGLAGRAAMSCEVVAEGLLSGCEVTEESPAGVGFGEAVLKMAPLFKMRPMTKDGQPVSGGTVRIPMRFVLPGEASIDPMSAMLACYGQTAVASEKDSTDEELIRAYSFFAAQVAVRNGQAKAKPTALEMNLVAARMGAQVAGPGQSMSGPGLKQCLSAFRANVPPENPPLR